MSILNELGMKKNKIALENDFWSRYEAGKTFKAITAFFYYASLDYYKQTLSEVVMYSYKREVYMQDNPSDVFIFYNAVSSFIKVCYGINEKSKKWKVKESLRTENVFHLSSLTEEEYENPFLVFQKAFNEITPEKYESFLCHILELSLSPNVEDPDSDLTTPYIYVIKMLDAVELLRERGVEKIKKINTVDSIAALNVL